MRAPSNFRASGQIIPLTRVASNIKDRGLSEVEMRARLEEKRRIRDAAFGGGIK